MTGASIEATPELRASSPREVKARMRPLFSQARVAASAHGVLDGLPGEERRKTGWMRTEAAGDAGPWRQQAIPGRGRRDADALRDVVRDVVRDHAIEYLGTDGAVPVIDKAWQNEPARFTSNPHHTNAGIKHIASSLFRDPLSAKRRN